MNIVLWVAAAVLALAFLFAGGAKLLQSKAQLASNPRMAWTADFSEGAIKLIGAAEVLGAIGLILPALTGIAPVLVPMAALGLALMMIGAIVAHVRRHEYPQVIGPIVLMLVALFVAWGRFGPYAF
jgi:uncharacterized membrane protein